MIELAVCRKAYLPVLWKTNRIDVIYARAMVKALPTMKCVPCQRLIVKARPNLSLWQFFAIENTRVLLQANGKM